MIPKLLVFTSGMLEQTSRHRAIVLTLLQDSRVGLILREPTASTALIQWLSKPIQDARACVILHTKTPQFDSLLHAAPQCGVHLPADADPQDWRHQIKGPLGQSTHHPSDAQKAFRKQVDYVTLSPVFASISKPNDRRPTLPLNSLQVASKHGRVFALGGITPKQVPNLTHTGVYGVAVLGSIFENGDPVDAFV